MRCSWTLQFFVAVAGASVDVAVILNIQVVHVVVRGQNPLPVNIPSLGNVAFVAELRVLLNPHPTPQDVSQSTKANLFHVRHAVDYQSIVLKKYAILVMNLYFENLAT